MTYSFDEGQYNSETNSETFAQFKNVIAARNIPIPAGSAGADIHLSMTAGQEVSGLDFKCMSNVDMTKGFQPIFELLNASIARSNSTEKMGGTCAENQCSRPDTLAGWEGFANRNLMLDGNGDQVPLACLLVRALSLSLARPRKRAHSHELALM